MNYSYLIVFLLIILHLVGCGNVNNRDNADVSLSIFGITFQGESQDEVITNLIEQTDEFDYFDEERTDIKRVIFCGVPFGLNLKNRTKRRNHHHHGDNSYKFTSKQGRIRCNQRRYF